LVTSTTDDVTAPAPASGRTPIWSSIAATLAAEIAAGHWRAGERLPTEQQLAQRFGVNRHTVRHALGALAADGTVRARRGAGVFVQALPPTDYPLGRRVRFHRNLIAAGRVPSRDIVRSETRRADPREAAALGLAEGAGVHVVEGVSRADGVPIAAFRSVFPAGRFPGLLAALADTGSVTVALAAVGVADYTRASTRLTAMAADAALAHRLHLDEGAPVLRTVGVNVDAGGRPVEYGITWFAGERVTLTVAPDEAPGDPALQPKGEGPVDMS
jgi:GntR family phosphonate transport system transcriptional regulator